MKMTADFEETHDSTPLHALVSHYRLKLNYSNEVHN